MVFKQEIRWNEAKGFEKSMLAEILTTRIGWGHENSLLHKNAWAWKRLRRDR